MAEDIEAKIRRLRELGRAVSESEEQPPTPLPPKPPKRRVSRIGMLREKERKKRIIIGALVLSIIIIGAIVSIYMYLENKAARELENAKKAKIAEVNACFKGELANDTAKIQLINAIMAAKSIEELNKINVKKVCEERWKALQEAKKRAEEERLAKELAELKNQTKANIKMAFDPLLQVQVPDELKKEVIDTMNMLLSQVDKAKTKEEVIGIDPTPYLLDLWKRVYIYRIDSIPGTKVILARGNVTNIYTKSEAKEVISKTETLSDLLQYQVKEVQLVQLALVLSRKDVNGGFLEPGDKIQIYDKRSGKRLVPEGYVVLVLFDAGQIQVSESQSKTNSWSSTSSTLTQESSSTNYTPGETPYQVSQTTESQTSVQESSSETLSASYSYSVNLAEILKAIAAGKITDPTEVQNKLEKYGWKVLTLEEASNLLALNENTRVLVIVEVPTEFVSEVLKSENYLVIAKISR
ncbi:DUF515 domain-containing protein [Pyrococcus kukulkanii]|uniref:DUF515 domain-containing protein n=1 Tax=Pyrococcus kukulkanii TaxID=1609559 RepID=UPI003569A9D0